MQEIDEKDLEKTSGGITEYDPHCDKYQMAREIYVYLPPKFKTCLTCVHFYRKDKMCFCDLQDGQGGQL